MPNHFYAFFRNCSRRLVQTRVDVLSLYKIVFRYTLLDRTCICFKKHVINPLYTIKYVQITCPFSNGAFLSSFDYLLFSSLPVHPIFSHLF